MSAPRKRAAISKAAYEIDRLQQKIMLLEYQYSVLKSLAEVAALAEREACKKICAEQADAAEERWGTSDDRATMAHSIWRLIHERSTASCGDAIRARGGETTAATAPAIGE